MIEKILYMKNGRFAILRIISRLCFYKYRESGTNVYFVSQVICETDYRREKGEEKPGVLADCDPGRAGADMECSKMVAGRGAYWIEGVTRVRE